MTLPRKTCRTCKVEKAISKFYTHKLCKGGYEGQCKACKKAYRCESYAIAPEKGRKHKQTPAYKAYMRNYLKRWRKTPSGLESRRISQRIYRAYRRAMGMPKFPSDLTRNARRAA